MLPTPHYISWPDGWLIQVLLERAAIQEEDLETILQARERTAWLSCTRSGVATDDSILAVLSAKFAMPLADATGIDPNARTYIAEDFARVHRVAPLRLNGRVLEVATSDAMAPTLESEIAFASGRRTRVRLASPAQLEDLLSRIYSNDGIAADVVVERSQPSSTPRQDSHGADSDREGPVVKLVNALIGHAIRDGASGIQLDPDPLGLCVRFRIADALIDMQRLPSGVSAPVLQRLKTMASLDNADRQQPQNGHAEAHIDGRRVGLRVSTLPARGRAETVVIHVLDFRGAPVVAPHCGTEAITA